jgi:hypothetical protein
VEAASMRERKVKERDWKLERRDEPDEGWTSSINVQYFQSKEQRYKSATPSHPAGTLEKRRLLKQATQHNTREWHDFSPLQGQGIPSRVFISISTSPKKGIGKNGFVEL